MTYVRGGSNLTGTEIAKKKKTKPNKTPLPQELPIVQSEEDHEAQILATKKRVQEEEMGNYKGAYQFNAFLRERASQASSKSSMSLKRPRQEEISSPFSDKDFDMSDNESEVTDVSSVVILQSRPGGRGRDKIVQCKSLNNIKVVFLNPNAKNNIHRAIHIRSLHIDEDQVTLLNDSPRAEGHHSRDPLSVIFKVYAKDNTGKVLEVDVNRHMKIFTQALYAHGSEVGYYGVSEGMHYTTLVGRFGYGLESKYPFKGMLHKDMVLLMTNAPPAEAYQTKWEKLIPNIVSSLRVKVNVVKDKV